MMRLEQLQKIEDKIGDWLKFAEAKNAALITFDSACIFVIGEYFLNLQSGFLKTTLATILIIFIFSVILCLISLIASVGKFNFLDSIFKKRTCTENDNLLFYKDIAKYEPTEYYKKIQEILNESNGNINSKLELNISKQIVILSEIAYRKYVIFNVAASLSFVPFIAAIVGIIIA